ATVRPVDADDLWRHECRMFGFPAGHDEGVWAVGTLLAAQASGWIQLDDDRDAGFAATMGFSGAPVWDERLGTVVGMVVAAESQEHRRTAYALPTRLLLEAWPELARYGVAGNPYRGLLAFREEDRWYFFGRAEAADRLTDRMCREPFTVVVGPSGCGKSSL